MAAKMNALEIKGIDFHIGSQLISMSPLLEALQSTLDFIDQLHSEGIVLEHLDIGGGLGITYEQEKLFPLDDYAKAVKKLIGSRPLKLILEPGRFIVGNAGILLTKVEYIKENSEKVFAIIDAGMNDLLRPALYEAWHAILPVQRHSDCPTKIYDIVGPVCETGDFLGLSRHLALKPDDLLAIGSAGAYGFSMASNYNTRPRPPEILIKEGKTSIIRARETLENLFHLELNN
jgi:diaminopimelate decarboxylase